VTDAVIDLDVGQIGMTRNLYCGIERIRCDGQCNSCVVRFKCYTEPIFTPLLVSREEWLILRTYGYVPQRVWVSGKVGELPVSVEHVL